MAAPAPALAVVLVAERWETIRRVVECLRDDDAPERIELVVATPSGDALDADADHPAAFARTTVVPVRRDATLADARAEGVRAASAPFVFLGETHVYPGPGFVAAILAAHARGYAAVAPAVENANPDGALSWAAYLADYGDRAPTLDAGERQHVAPYNTSFVRAALLEHDERLGELLSPSSELSAALRGGGHRFVFEPGARVSHLNVSRAGPWAAERFLGGRLVAEGRNGRWPASRRAVYAAGAPLIPPLLVARFLRDVPHRSLPLPRGTFAAVALGALLWAAGELTGYVAGGTSGARRMVKYELDKVDYVAS
jgi:hypothetical protein